MMRCSMYSLINLFLRWNFYYYCLSYRLVLLIPASVPVIVSPSNTENMETIIIPQVRRAILITQKYYPLYLCPHFYSLREFISAWAICLTASWEIFVASLVELSFSAGLYSCLILCSHCTRKLAVHSKSPKLKNACSEISFCVILAFDIEHIIASLYSIPTHCSTKLLR